MKKLTRKQVVERDMVVFGKVMVDDGNVNYFEGLTASQVETLIQKGYLNPEETQNDSPTSNELLTIMKEFPGVKANGYVVSAKRSDHRITITALEYVGKPTKELRREFKSLTESADESILKPRHLYVWWD